MDNDIYIFDFDGTIADTFQFTVDISNQLSSEFNYKEIEPHEVEGLKDKSSQEIIEHLGVPIMKIPAIVAKTKSELQKCIDTIKPIEGLQEMLLHLKELGHEIGILTSNSSENVMKFLENHNLELFDFVNVTSKIWSKNMSLKKLIKKEGLPIDKVVYIGDETRDIIAAKKAGVTAIAVTWGYNSPEALKKHKPDHVLNKPEDLIRLSNSK